jgi:hypothetical protein
VYHCALSLSEQQIPRRPDPQGFTFHRNVKGLFLRVGVRPGSLRPPPGWGPGVSHEGHLDL